MCVRHLWQTNAENCSFVVEAEYVTLQYLNIGSFRGKVDFIRVLNVLFQYLYLLRRSYNKLLAVVVLLFCSMNKVVFEAFLLENFIRPLWAHQ